MSNSKGYNTSKRSHRVKSRINRLILERYAGTPARHAVILPSTTACDVRICRELGIYDDRTRFTIFERGLPSVSKESFIARAGAAMRAAMGDGSWRLSDHLDGLFYCPLEDQSSYLGNLSRYRGLVDFANYDTCSNYLQILKWMPYHVAALRPGAPFVLTLDADYNLRWDRDEIREMAGCRWPRGVEFVCDGDFEGAFSNDELLRDIDTRKIPGVISFLRRNGLRVEVAARYRDHLPMMMFAGRKP